MSVQPDYSYAGEELSLFAEARNWKAYWGKRLEPYLDGEVLEVGAGIGANTRLLRRARQRRWVCLEPDGRLVGQLRQNLSNSAHPYACEFRQGTLNEVPASEQFDVIIYIDVLEHIKDAAAELTRAAGHLRDDGRLLVLAPAHGWLFSPFDAAIGHFRRYNRKSLAAAAKEIAGLRLERIEYLDSVGLLASLGNRLLLRQGLPTQRQIRFWDGGLVPLSRLFDPVLLHRFGKSIFGVWRKVRPA